MAHIFSRLAATQPPDLIKTITEFDATLQAASMTYDTATIRTLISDDFTLITSSGRVLNGSDLLAAVGDKSVTWYINSPSDVRVRAYNEDCAVVTAILHERYESGGKLSEHRVRYTDTWVKLNGAWRYVAGHASRLP